VAGNRVEVRIRGVWGDIVTEHAAASDYGNTADAAYAVKRCVGAVLIRPLAVLVLAVDLLWEDPQLAMGEEELRLAQALADAGRAYVDYWKRHDEALGLETGEEV
jgi:hypothetical protein